MKRQNLLQRRRVLVSRVQRAYRYSEIRKLILWFKGKTLAPLQYLVLALLLVGGSQGYAYYRDGLVDLVQINGHPVGLVRNAAEVEHFVDDLMEKCSLLYGMDVFPQQRITYTREFHPHPETDFERVTNILRQRISLMTKAVMVSIDGRPALPVSTEEEVDQLSALLCQAHVSPDEDVTVLETVLLEELGGSGCVVPPEQVYPAETIAAVLTGEERSELPPGLSRDLLASRSGRAEWDHADGPDPELPLVHVQIVEQVPVDEPVPFVTTYQNNSAMWSDESRVLTAGAEGLKQVTYRITRVNEEEIAREIIAEQLIREPVTRVIERGTACRFAWPVAGGGRITQYFKGRAHMGIDIGAPLGTSILAAESGTVVRSAWASSQGNYIIIKHDGYWTLYLHHSANLASAGQWVSRGQTIARLGSTGHSTGPHLHFEIRRNNGSGIWTGWYDHPALDPLQYFR